MWQLFPEATCIYFLAARKDASATNTSFLMPNAVASIRAHISLEASYSLDLKPFAQVKYFCSPAQKIFTSAKSPSAAGGLRAESGE
jgi:hypothetical protein